MARVQRVFISYRREDAADVAGRIRDWLVQTWNLARENVFMDVSTILPGADFEQVIDQAIAQCDAMIIVMSPSWLTHVYTSDTSYPRFEAEAALRRNLLIIPLLVGGATTPTAEQLPETLRPLLRRNIRLIRPDSFDYDMEWVRKALGVRTISRAPFITAISALLLVAASLGTLSQAPEGNPVWRVFHSSTATPTTSPSSPRPFVTTSPSVSPSPDSKPTVTAVVSAVKGTYSGTCPPPEDATTYKAVISVSSGPTTVRFRWTSSNGGDTDPSEQTLTFSGTGPQQQTVTHNEAFYLPGKTVTDWVAVNLISPVTGQSNHADFTLTCQQPGPTVTVAVSAVKGTYSGTCPPPKDATTYKAVISVSSGPTTVRFRWTTSNGGDTDPSEQTLTFSGTGPQQQTVTHNEAFYLPGQTVTDWVAVNLISPVTGQSNHVTFQLTCQQ